MAFTVLYDSNVLYPNTVRDLLIRLARHGIVQAKWTEQILDEVQEALRRNDVGDDEKRAELRRRMNAAVRDCLVTDYEPLIEGLKLPDPDDRIVYGCVMEIANSRTRVPVTFGDILDQLERSRLIGAVSMLRAGPSPNG